MAVRDIKPERYGTMGEVLSISFKNTKYKRYILPKF